MTQDQLIIIILKAGLITGFASLVLWIAVYTRLAPWWRDPVGRTLVIKTALIAAVFVPTTLSLFFQFSRLSSHIAAWVQVGLICLVTPVMLWRTVVWIQMDRDPGGRGELPGAGYPPAADADDTGSP